MKDHDKKHFQRLRQFFRAIVYIIIGFGLRVPVLPIPLDRIERLDRLRGESIELQAFCHLNQKQDNERNKRPTIY